MKCYSDERDVCHNQELCSLQKKCMYEKELNKKIQEFNSGAKSSGNKPPYECLTLDLFRRAALRMKLGMHYGKHNWKNGAGDKNFIVDRLNHAIEHLIKAQSEIENDEHMTDDDLAAVVVNCMMAMEYQNRVTFVKMAEKEENDNPN